jgi:hypothetical protein
MNGKIIFILIASLAFACKDAENHNAREAAAAAPKTPGDSLYAIVDKAHIDGMKRIAKLKRALGQVQHALDSMVKLPAKKIDEQYQQSLVDLQEDLNYADYAMTTWMVEFKDTLKDADQRVKYLKAEEEKVTKVRDNIINGLQRADSLLKK